MSELQSKVMLKVVASLLTVILMTLEVLVTLLESSVMLLENIYNTGVTHDDHQTLFKIFL